MTKKLILLVLTVLGTFAAKAQTQQGNQLLGGFLNLNTEKTNYVNRATGYDVYGNTNYYPYTATSKTNAFGIGPVYSYFVANNLDLGVTLGYNASKESVGVDVNNAPMNTYGKAHSYAASVYLRRYFLYNDKIGIRTGPFASYGYTKNEVDYDANPSANTFGDEKTLTAGIGVDLVYFPTRRLGLASSLGSLSYQHDDNSLNVNSHYKTNSFGLNLATTSLTFSMFYVFGK